MVTFLQLNSLTSELAASKPAMPAPIMATLQFNAVAGVFLVLFEAAPFVDIDIIDVDI